MRSSYGPETLLRASRKPHVQDLVARCIEMTDDEIDALAEKPDVKRGLKNIRRQHLQGEAAVRAEAIALIMIAAHNLKHGVK